MAELGKDSRVLDLVVPVAAVRTGERDHQDVLEERNVGQHHSGFALLLAVGAETLHDDGCVTVAYALGTWC